MKKTFVIAMLMFMATGAFAQDYVTVKKVIWKNENVNVNEEKSRGGGKYSGSIVIFSDNTTLIYDRYYAIYAVDKWKECWYNYTGEDRIKVVDIEIQMGENVEGQWYERIYTGGCNCETFAPVEPEKIGVYTIKKVSMHDVHSEFSADMNVDISHKGAFVILAGWNKTTSQVTGSAKGGGLRTITNIFFDNGKKITIEASTAPIWLDAEPGMTVEHYRIGNRDCYNLL